MSEPFAAEAIARAWEQLAGRLDGPLWVRFVVQPIVAASLAIRAGVRDARLSRLPYLRALFTNVRDRPMLLRSAWQDVGRVFVVAAVLDAIYQIAILRFFYPLQTFAVAVALSFVPYVAVRGMTARLVRLRLRRQSLTP